MEDVVKIPVSPWALWQRLNRRLAQDGQALRTARSAAAQATWGRWYLVDWHQGTVVQAHVDPAALARELWVLQPWEEVREEQT